MMDRPQYRVNCSVCQLGGESLMSRNCPGTNAAGHWIGAPDEFRSRCKSESIGYREAVRRDNDLGRERAPVYRAVADPSDYRTDVSPDAVGPEGPVEPGF